MTYFFVFTTIALLIYVVFNRKKPDTPELIERAIVNNNIYSIYRQGGKYTLQLYMRKWEKTPELFTVYINQNTATKLINGKSIINKLFTDPINGLIHYAKPDEGISELKSAKDIKLDIPERFNPFKKEV